METPGSCRINHFKINSQFIAALGIYFDTEQVQLDKYIWSKVSTLILFFFYRISEFGRRV